MDDVEASLYDLIDTIEETKTPLLALEPTEFNAITCAGGIHSADGDKDKLFHHPLSVQRCRLYQLPFRYQRGSVTVQFFTELAQRIQDRGFLRRNAID